MIENPNVIVAEKIVTALIKDNFISSNSKKEWIEKLSTKGVSEEEWDFIAEEIFRKQNESE